MYTNVVLSLESQTRFGFAEQFEHVQPLLLAYESHICFGQSVSWRDLRWFAPLASKRESVDPPLL